MAYKLQKMEINGFKSFFSKSELTFPSNITAVVGPNGCGKSNISDAVSWVLGEQSAKSLRGKTMEDVIFSGTQTQQPLGMAQVTLILSPSGGATDQNGQLEITRKLFRSGESEYLLNNRRVRLKDIRDVLFGRGMGNADTAVVEQGRVHQIISNKSQERRSLIENAAGVSQYKIKRRLAEGRLGAAKTNLVTVGTLANELERQLRSLKRQAGIAHRYGGIVEQYNTAKKLALGIDHARHVRDRDRLLREREEAARELAAVSGALARKEIRLEEGRSTLEEKQALLLSERERVHAEEVKIERLETSGAAMREALEASGQRQKDLVEEATRLEVAQADTLKQIEGARLLSGELEHELQTLTVEVTRRQEAHAAALQTVEEMTARRNSHATTRTEAMDLLLASKNQLRGLDRDRGSITAELDRLRQRMAELDQSHGPLGRLEEENREATVSLTSSIGEHVVEERRLASLAETAGHHRTDLAGRLQTAQGRRASLEEQLNAVERMVEERLGFSSSVKRLLGSAPPELAERIKGPLADFIKVEKTDERPVERFLGEKLEWILVEDGRAAQQIKDWMGSAGISGPCTLVPLDAAGEMAPPAPDGLEPLLGRVSIPEFCLRAVTPLLSRVYLVESIGAGLEASSGVPGATFLTPEGDCLSAAGTITCWGAKSDGAQQDEAGDGPLALRRRARELDTERTAAAEEEARLARELKATETEVTRLAGDLVRVSHQLKECENERFKTRHEGERLKAALEENRRQHRGLAEVSTKLAADLERLQQEEVRLQQHSASLVENLNRLNEEGEEIHRREAELRGRQESIRAELEETRTALAACRERLEGAKRTRKGLAEALEDLAQRTGRTQKARAAELEKQESLKNAIRESGETRAAHLETLDALRKRVNGAEQACNQLARDTALLNSDVKSIRKDVDAAREKKEVFDIDLTRVTSEIGFFETEHKESFGQPLEAIPAWQLAKIETESVEDPLEKARADAEKFQAHLQRMGQVNMRAIEECESTETRFRFVSEQKTDIEESIASLEKTIKRINVTSRKRFLDALEQINTSFEATFSDFFGGGTATISLPDGADPLESDIDITARPPGKKNQNVLQLSGGEKALTAIAFLFSVLKYRPTPFCILDEVDAALDDANVDRFLNLMKEMSKETQFILITHNKVTMESADLLYGVTMEEPGISKLVSVSLKGYGNNGNGSRLNGTVDGFGSGEWAGPVPEAGETLIETHLRA
jgi:chromosome segregation protein